MSLDLFAQPPGAFGHHSGILGVQLQTILYVGAGPWTWSGTEGEKQVSKVMKTGTWLGSMWSDGMTYCAERPTVFGSRRRGRIGLGNLFFRLLDLLVQPSVVASVDDVVMWWVFGSLLGILVACGVQALRQRL